MIQEAFPVATQSPTAIVSHVESNDYSKSSDTFNRVENIARMLAHSGFTPKHLVVPNDPERSVANCFRVAGNAVRWELDPFSVADQTYSVGGKLAYQGQLVIAIIHRHAGLDGKLSFTFDGKVGTDELTVTVSGKFKGAAEPSTLKLSVGQAKTDNQMWKKDPEQKLCYSGATRWARRYCPEVVLGVMTFEDLEVIAEQEAPELPVDLRTEEEKKADEEKARKEAMAKQRAALAGGKGVAKVDATPVPAIDVVATKPADASPSPASQEAKVEAKPITDAVKDAVVKLYTAASKAGQFTAPQLTAYLGKCGAAKLSELTDEQGLELKGLLFNATTPADVGNARTEVANAAPTTKPETKPAATRTPIAIRPPVVVEKPGENPYDGETTLYTMANTITKSQHARIAELMKALPASAWPLEEKKAFLAGLKIANIHGLSNFQAGMLIVELEKLASELAVKVGEPAAA